MPTRRAVAGVIGSVLASPRAPSAPEDLRPMRLEIRTGEIRPDYATESRPAKTRGSRNRRGESGFVTSRYRSPEVRPPCAKREGPLPCPRGPMEGIRLGWHPG